MKKSHKSTSDKSFNNHPIHVVVITQEHVYRLVTNVALVFGLLSLLALAVGIPIVNRHVNFVLQKIALQSALCNAQAEQLQLHVDQLSR